MKIWQISFVSGDAKGSVWVSAETASAAKNSAFNQFLKLEKSYITWEGVPTFWVRCIGVKELEEVHKQINQDENSTHQC